MIDTATIELDGREFEWNYEPDQLPTRCWHWAEVGKFVAPGTAITAELNRRFIVDLAASIVENMDVSELPRFLAILQAMGATSRDLERPGLELLLQLAAPERYRQRQFDDLPPAAHTPLNCLVLRDWMFSSPESAFKIPSIVTCLGSGPFERLDLVAFLFRRNVFNLEFQSWGAPLSSFGDQFAVERFAGQTIPPPGIVIVGREDWDEETLDDAIDWHEGQVLRIYSQEMFVSFLLCGKDPFAASPDVLAAFRAGHPSLEFVSEGWTGWVSTFVTSAWRSGAKTPVSGRWQSESPLHALGYKVGKSGLSLYARQETLTKAFEGDLPAVVSAEYMADWGEPGSAQRLNKTANLLASLCRNRRRKVGGHTSDEAIDDWETDLAWLRDTFYHGHFAFHWPETLVSS